MRARIVVGGVLVSVGILAAGVESAVAQHQTTESASGSAGTGSASGTSGTAGTGASSGSAGTGSAGSGSASSGSSSTSGSSSSGSSSSGSSGSTASSAYKDGTYTGTAESTQFGDVQVKVTISGGKISDVTALQLTDREQRSVQISDYAAPILRQEAIAADSSQIDTVSGATYTSEAYIGSLQSALDQAG